jgi:3-isopropylmalate dehydratase small subunit
MSREEHDLQPPQLKSVRITNGKAWIFGDNINTDIIIPFRFKSRTNDPYEMAKYAMYGYDPDFHKKISNGDVIVAGRNFGGGSKRTGARSIEICWHISSSSCKLCTYIL